MKFIKLFIVLIILSLSAGVSYYLYGQIVRTAQDEEDVVEVTGGLLKSELSFSDEVLEVGKEKTIAIQFDSNFYQVVGVDIVIEYDVESIEVISVEAGDVFNNEIKNSTSESAILYSASTEIGTTFSGQGNIAFITIRPLKSGETELSFRYGDDGAATYIGGVDNTEVPVGFSSKTYHIREIEN